MKDENEEVGGKRADHRGSRTLECYPLSLQLLLPPAHPAHRASQSVHPIILLLP